MDEIENETNPDKGDKKTSNDENKLEELAKKLKGSDSGLGKSEESSSSSNTDLEMASMSMDIESAKSYANPTAPPVTFRGSPNSRNRNYRSPNLDEDNGEERDPMAEEQPEEEEAPTVEAVELPILMEPNDPVQEEEEEIDSDWDNNDDENISSDDTNLSSNSSDDSTVMPTADIDISDHPLFKKEKPKHRWFALNEIGKRQMGYSSKLQSRELFQRRCYGSLHCVSRLELMYKLEGHEGCVNSLNFHPDGSLLASGSDDLKIIIWDWKVGKSLLKYKSKHRGNVFQSKFLPLSGDLHVASCARDGQVRLARLNSDEGVKNSKVLANHKGPCHKLIVLPERPQIILSAGEDGVVFNHDIRGPKSTRVVKVMENGVKVSLYSIHGHPLKSHEFCVSGTDSIIRIYDQRRSKKPAATFTPYEKIKSRSSKNHHSTCAVYNYNGSEILASYNDNEIYLFDTKDTEPGKFIHQYQGHRNVRTIKGVNFFGPKSEFVVSGSDCGYIYFWERNTESLVQWLLADDQGVVNCLEPHPQLPFICTSGLDHDVKVWVPSCEEDPKMEGLKNIVKRNVATKLPSLDVPMPEDQMLFMVFRHLTNANRSRAENLLNMRDLLHLSNESNSSESMDNSDHSESFEASESSERSQTSEDSDERSLSPRNCNAS